MAEKILNTRIQLKYDNFEDWRNGPFNGDDSSKWLKPGEIAIVTLAPNKETEPDNQAYQHPLLFKVGTGNHSFDELPWASALAADVYGWAKQSENDFVDNFLALKMTDGTTMKSKLEAAFITETELFAALGDFGTVVGKQIGDLSGLETEAKDLVSAINEVLNAVEVGGTGSVVTVKKAETATEGSVATYTVQQGGKDVEEKIEIPEMVYDAENAHVVQIQDEEAEVVIGLGIEDTTITPRTTLVVTPTGLNAAKEELIGELETNTKNSDTIIGAKLYTDAAKAELIGDAKKDTEDSETITGAKMYTDAAITAAKAELIGDANDDKDANTICGAKELADGLYKAVLGTTADEAGAATVHGALNAAAAVLGKTTDAANDATVYGALKAAADAQADIDAFLANADTTQDAIDTLKEIQDFLNSDDGTVQTLIDKVDANEEAIADIVDGTTKVKSAEHADTASTLDTAGITQVQGIKVNNAANADSATNADNATNAGHANTADTAGHANTADTATNAGHATTADDATRATTASGLDAVGIAQVEGIKVNNATNADTATNADNAAKLEGKTASDFATAAQGAKADSALQEITTTADGGLKITPDENDPTKIQIDIDTDVVFVFNCGNAFGFNDK